MWARGWLVCGFAIASCASLFSVVDAQAGRAERLEGIAGVWRYADGREGERRIDEAVARAVDELPFFLEDTAHGPIPTSVSPSSSWATRCA
jgi:hypothetical protein